MVTMHVRGTLSALALVSLMAAVGGSTALTPRQAFATPAVPPISARGVRGDVLLAMMVQYRCGRDTWSTQSYNGPVVPDSETGTPFVNTLKWIYTQAPYRPGSHAERIPGTDKALYMFNPYSTLAENAGSHGSPPSPNTGVRSWWSGGLGRVQPLNEDFGRCTLRDQFNGMQQGVFTLRARSFPAYAFHPHAQRPPLWNEPWVKRGFNHLSADLTLIVGRKHFALAPHARATSREDLQYRRLFHGDPSTAVAENEAHEQFRGKPRRFHAGARVGFGDLTRLSGIGPASQDSLIRAFIAPGAHGQQAKFCVHARTRYARRLHCNVWEVPSGWQWPHELRFVDEYIIDDRSVYPGESGLRYWRGNPEDLYRY